MDLRLQRAPVTASGPASRAPSQARDGAHSLRAAVLFTDMRSSSELVTRVSPHAFFGILNRVLGPQASCVRAHQGRVVKFTGDGLLAVFEGERRCRAALQAACALAAASTGSELPYGVGLAEGWVMAGPVGGEAPGLPLQFDVIGATVHLAARLCESAGPGEAVTTGEVWREAGLQPKDAAWPRAWAESPIRLRGFAEPVSCVRLRCHPRG
ncbi:adenylate/guanylate cyclase domain-containing protein [Ramlibacter sp. AN1015]|uniref:adenylate/guanylate cyclase domain-containing protein n=1 Tax=Ramlibacter sp. AN1015 TaxID=3133428 RepID=UPI0030BF73FB